MSKYNWLKLSCTLSVETWQLSFFVIFRKDNGADKFSTRVFHGTLLISLTGFEKFNQKPH